MMMTSEILTSLLGIGVTVLIFGVVQLQSIRKTVEQIAVQLAGLESWRQEHDNRDDERFAEQGRRLTAVESWWNRGRGGF